MHEGGKKIPRLARRRWEQDGDSHLSAEVGLELRFQGVEEML